MQIGTGTLEGRGIYNVTGRFTLTQGADGRILFETDDKFRFDDGTGRGTPAPGFALFIGDPTGLPNAVVGPIAKSTDFLRLTPDVAVRGRQSGVLLPGTSLWDYDTLFLWCYRFPTVLGVGAIVLEE
ncbi:hypothetical protein V8J82_12980 [Gymnodinialimonas sp. 2305UL16-5]|uniref:hypothetical protein n=1 Tax=Gymnodinialimonas mytili TaxID=3126503 RepID=UPI003098F1F6